MTTMTETDIEVPNGASAKQVLMNPTMAELLLKSQGLNRPLRKGHVDKLAGIMKRGEWLLNGDAIRVANTGRLLDGQHRLHACIRSGASFWTFLVTGLDENVFESIDVDGYKRSHANVLAIKGYKNSTTLAAVCRQIRRVERGDKAPSLGGQAVTVAQSMDVLDRWPEAHEVVRRVASQKQPFMRGLTIPATVITIGQYTHGERALEFHELLTSGAGLKHGHPVLTLRNTLIAAAMSRNVRHTPLTMWAFHVKAWSAFVRRKPLRLLRRSTAEKMPAMPGFPYGTVRAN